MTIFFSKMQREVMVLISTIVFN